MEDFDETWITRLESLRASIQSYVSGTLEPMQLHQAMTQLALFLRDPLYQRKRDAEARCVRRA